MKSIETKTKDAAEIKYHGCIFPKSIRILKCPSRKKDNEPNIEPRTIDAAVINDIRRTSFSLLSSDSLSRKSNKE